MTIKQLSPEWFERRRNSITGTDASIIMGHNTFSGNCPYKLWQLKLGLIKPEPMNEAMKKGRGLENEALQIACSALGKVFSPDVCFNPDNMWQMASLDGLSDDRNSFIEIKIGKGAYSKALEGIIPKYYVDQIQHYFMVTLCDKAYYCAFNPENLDDYVIIEVFPDLEYQKAMFKKEEAFFKCIKNMDPPKDKYSVNQDSEKELLAIRLKNVKAKIDELKLEEEGLKKELLENLSEDTLFAESKVKISRVDGRVTINWKAYQKDNLITTKDLKPYEKKGDDSWRITVEKQKHS